MSHSSLMNDAAISGDLFLNRALCVWPSCRLHGSWGDVWRFGGHVLQAANGNRAPTVGSELWNEIRRAQRFTTGQVAVVPEMPTWPRSGRPTTPCPGWWVCPLPPPRLFLLRHAQQSLWRHYRQKTPSGGGLKHPWLVSTVGAWLNFQFDHFCPWLTSSNAPERTFICLRRFGVTISCWNLLRLLRRVSDVLFEKMIVLHTNPFSDAFISFSHWVQTRMHWTCVNVQSSFVVPTQIPTQLKHDKSLKPLRLQIAQQTITE